MGDGYYFTLTERHQSINAEMSGETGKGAVDSSLCPSAHASSHSWQNAVKTSWIHRRVRIQATPTQATLFTCCFP